MSTIAEKLEYLNGTKTAIREAITAKGVSISDTDAFRSYADKISAISGGSGGADTIAGLSLTDFLGGVTDGTLSAPESRAITLSGVTTIGGEALKNKLGSASSFSAPGVTTIKQYGMQNAFDPTRIRVINFPDLQIIEGYGCYQMVSSGGSFQNLDLFFPELVEIQQYGLFSAFENMEISTFPSFSKLTTVKENGLDSAFSGLRNITTNEINFAALTTLEANALRRFLRNKQNFTGIISFPALTTVDPMAFGGTGTNAAFDKCSVSEIHFPVAMEETISALTGFSTKWGATSATIYFDL